MAPLTDLDEANEKIRELHAEIERLRSQLDLLRRQIFGRRRESIDPNQLLLFETGIDRLAQLEKDAQEVAPPPPRKKRSGNGRALFRGDLPHQDFEIELPEHERLCPDCGEAMGRIGCEVTTRGRMIPARMVVNRYIRGKYACRHGHFVKSAPPPPGVIDKAKYEPSVYAHVATAKYLDSVPLNRLEGIFRRYGVSLSKQTMWDMLVRIDEIVAQPILKEMKRQLLEESVLQTDETTIKVKREGQRGTYRGVLWVWRNVRGSPYEKVIADFQCDRSARGPDAFLGTWSGELVTDGFDGVNPVANRNNIRRGGCWTHARRKFLDALKSGAKRAALALRYIQRLFWIERAIYSRLTKGDPDRQPELDELIKLREDVRPRRSKVVLLKLYEVIFALDEDPTTKGHDLLVKAVRYAINQRNPLLAHLDNGRLPIHNNDTERDLRHVVTGRKNWLIFASEKGGRVAANLYSLVMSGKLARINVEAYLEDVLQRVATTPATDIARLTPWAWAREQAEATSPQ